MAGAAADADDAGGGGGGGGGSRRRADLERREPSAALRSSSSRREAAGGEEGCGGSREWERREPGNFSKCGGRERRGREMSGGQERIKMVVERIRMKMTRFFRRWVRAAEVHPVHPSSVEVRRRSPHPLALW